MPAYSHFDYYLRSLTATVLALAILGVTAWQVLHGSTITGPFKDWAGLIIGVYFGQHVSLNGAGARRRLQAEQDGPIVGAVTVPVVPVATVPPVPPETPHA